MFKVNIDNLETLKKKFIRAEKRKLLKRKRPDEEEKEGEEKIVLRVDKNKIDEMILNGTYDLSLHFSKKQVLELDKSSKARSVSILKISEKSIIIN